METSLRLILLLIGFVIIVGIIWDSKRNNKKDQKVATRREPNNELFLSEPTQSQLVEPSAKSVSSKNEEFIMIHVMAKRGNFSGGELLDIFNELYLYYGEMQIFYRYEHVDGTGNTMFNVVSAVEPGYFEISKMEHFVTPGVTLFFTLTRPNQSIAAFELMLRTAKRLAIRLDGMLTDERHSLLTAQIIEQYRDRIRKLQPQFRAIRAN